jgi:glucose-6-phosphate dehydrogenase assembly protein OpcA
MATNYKVLGQSAPLATTATTLYTVPASTEVVVSTITVCNRGSSAGTYRIAIRPNGDALANVHYVAFDSPINPKDTIALTLGITANAADVITVYASTADFTFNAFGSEIS